MKHNKKNYLFCGKYITIGPSWEKMEIMISLESQKEKNSLHDKM